MQDILHVALTETEYADVAGYDAAACQLVQIRHCTFLPHRVALARRTGQHENVLAVGFKRTAGCRAPQVGEYGAALGQPCLLFVVLGHFAANGLEKVGQTVHGRLMQHHLFAENGCQRLLGQIIKGWAKAAGGDDDVSTVLCLADYALETRRIVTDNGLVEYIDAQLGQTLRDELCIGVYDVAQQDLCADCDKFCVHFELPPFIVVRLIRE